MAKDSRTSDLGKYRNMLLFDQDHHFTHPPEGKALLEWVSAVLAGELAQLPVIAVIDEEGNS